MSDVIFGQISIQKNLDQLFAGTGEMDNQEPKARIVDQKCSRNYKADKQARETAVNDVSKETVEVVSETYGGFLEALFSIKMQRNLKHKSHRGMLLSEMVPHFKRQ